MVYVDGDAVIKATTITVASSTSNDIANIDLYQDTVIVKHESTAGTASTTIADMAIYDSTDDADIQYTASSTAGTLELNLSSTTQELHVWTGDTFTAYDEVTLYTSTSTDSSLHIDDSAELNLIATSSIHGSIAIDTSATLVAPEGTLTVRGDYVNNGTFDANGGTLNLEPVGYWDVGNGVRYGAFHSVYSQENTPQSLFFKPDGTKMYVVGSSGDDINTYALSIPWDVTTASVYGAVKSVSAEDTAPRDIFFKPDGTKMYMLGDVGDDINTYTLSTPWDVTTATFDGAPFSVGGQDIYPQGIFFKPDGTKMYVLGRYGDDVNVYTLGTAWDVTTATFDGGTPFSVRTQEDNPQDIAFNPDGTEMYIMGYTGDDINIYTLSTPWDPTTATFDGVLPVVEANPRGFFFKPDGTKMYMVGDWRAVYTYLFAGTQTFSGAMTDTSAFNNVIANAAGTSTIDGAASTTDLMIGDDGIFIASTTLDIGGDYINVGTFVQSVGETTFYASSSQYIHGQIGNVSLGNSGEKEIKSVVTDNFTVNSGTTVIVPSSLTVQGNYQNNGTTTYSEGGNVTFSSDSAQSIEGNLTSSSALGNVYFSGSGTKTFNTNASTSNFTINSEATAVAPYKLTITGDYENSGTFSNSAGNVYLEEGVAEGWDISTAVVYGTNLTPYGGGTGPNDIYISPDGTKMFITEDAGDEVNGYTLSTPWDATTASVIGAAFPFGTGDTVPQSLFFKPDGTKMYMIGGNDRVHTFTLSTPWNHTTSVLESSFGVYNQETAPTGIFFKPDGTKMYIIGSSGDDITTYLLSTPWEVTTASTYGAVFDIDTQDTAPTGLYISPDGTKMYMTGDTNNRVYKYTLSTPWDMTTASFDNFFSVGGQETAPNGVFFKPDGTRMFVIGDSGDDVNTYALDISPQTASGTMTGTSAFNNVEILTASTTTFVHNASTTDLTISAGTTTAPEVLTIGGDYSNSGIFDANGGTVVFSSTSPQTLSGTMTGTSAFNNVDILSAATTTFSDAATVTDTFTNNTAGSAMVFPASATSTFTNIDIQGTSGNEIYLRSSSDGTQWGIVVTGTQQVAYVNVKDSNACDGSDIGHVNSTVTNSSCWTATSFITISGTLYSDEGSTEITGGKDIKLIIGVDSIDGTFSTSTEAASGDYVFNQVFQSAVADGSKVIAYVDGDTDVYASAFTIASSSESILDLDLYQDTVIVRNESTDANASTTIADMAFYDSSDDTDIQYTASSTLNTFEFPYVDSTQELHVWKGDNFTPNGEMTLRVASTSKSSLHIDDSSTLNLGATTTVWGGLAIDAGATLVAPASTLTVHGDYTNNGTFTHSSGTVDFSPGGTWNVSSTSASYEGNNLYIDPEEASPSGISFKPDGTKMYVVGYSGDDVTTYTLSIPWKVATGLVDESTPFSVATEEIYPTGIFFKPDGTKMYVVGYGGDEVNPYTLSTPWDVSSATFDGSPFSVATEEDLPHGLFFKPDGTKMYVVGKTGDDVNTYTLSTPWDVSSATFDGSPFPVASPYPGGISFKPDGTKMYIMDGYGFYIYTLSTAWDVSSASLFETISLWNLSYLSLGTGDDVFFHPLGTSFYLVDSGFERVYEVGLDSEPQTIFGTMTGTSAFNDVAMSGSGTSTFEGSASTTNLTAGVDAKISVASSTVSVAGDYQNTGTFLESVGTTTFYSNNAQSISGEVGNVVFEGGGVKALYPESFTEFLLVTSSYV
ncbi:hypothetical protein OAD26_00385, partial [bacterium]|nr:hypothetical protein [bacterium]